MTFSTLVSLDTADPFQTESTLKTMPENHDAAPTPQSLRHVTVQTTADSAEAAEKLAAAVVDAQLAACAQVSEIRSFYRWKGEVHHEPEQSVTFKTTASAAPALQQLLQEQHPYEEPEIIVQPIIAGSPGYLEWVSDNSRGRAR